MNAYGERRGGRERKGVGVLLRGRARAGTFVLKGLKKDWEFKEGLRGGSQ